MAYLRPRQAGAALAATASILYFACVMLASLLPGTALASLFIDVPSSVSTGPVVAPLGAGQIFVGFVIATGLSWLLGATFAAFYNLIGKWLPEERW